MERLRYVLSVQREHYLPLKVIREHLEQIDRGQAPLGLTRAQRSARGSAAGAQSQNPVTAKQPIRLTRQELLEASGLTEAALGELERTQILHTRRGTAHYGRDALTLAIAARRLAEYGIDGRHLRAFKYRPTVRSGWSSRRSRRTCDGRGPQRPRCAGGRHAAGDQLPCGAGADRRWSADVSMVRFAGEG